MVRVKRGLVARRRRKKIFLIVKGVIGSNSHLFRIAQQHTIKAIRYSYRGRQERKRFYRSLWLVRLNARVQVHGWNYSSFLSYLHQKKYLLNRKTLAQMVVYDPISFQRLLDLFYFSYMSLIFFKNVSQSSEDFLLVFQNSINYKNVNLLRHYVGFTGKILPRRITKLNAKDHRVMAKAIRQARNVSFLPFVWLTNLLLFSV